MECNHRTHEAVPGIPLVTRRRALQIVLGAVAWGSCYSDEVAIYTREVASASELSTPIPATPGERWVILLDGFNSSSLNTSGDLDATNHTVRIDFAHTKRALSRIDPVPRFVFFSYGVAEQLASGLDPRDAWSNATYEDASEPIYGQGSTINLRVSEHVGALNWLVSDILTAHPDATIDLIGYSLGGIIAMKWAVDQTAEMAGSLAAIHRIVLLDCPVNGVTRSALSEGVRNLLRLSGIDLGDGEVLEDLVSGSATITALPLALGAVDVASIENSSDAFVNGTFGDGAFTSGLFPTGQTYYEDLGGRDFGIGRVVEVHRLILIGSSPALDRARDRMVDLIAADGPLWVRRQVVALAATPSAQPNDSSDLSALSH